MPRKLIKRFTPNPDSLKSHKHLSFLSAFLGSPNLWHLNRHSVARAFFVGLFCAFLPLPFQMVIAAMIAIPFRANIPISVALVWISNPLTMGPLYYACYLVGDFVLGGTGTTFAFELSWDWVLNGMQLIWKPFLLGCLIIGLSSGVLGYFAIKAYWRWHVVNRWRLRRE